MKITSYPANKLHRLGGASREKDKLEESLVYETLALAKFIKAKDCQGISDTFLSRFLTWKHLFLLEGDQTHLELAKSDVMLSFKTAERNQIKSIFPKCYFCMGEALMLEKRYRDASGFYSKAIRLYKGSLSEKGDYRYHLGEALYRSGKKDRGYQTMIRGLSEIEKGREEVDSFIYNVWKSGCLMRLSQLLKNDKSKKAREYLKLAKEVIKSDDRLIIRKRQFSKLEKSFKVR